MNFIIIISKFLKTPPHNKFKWQTEKIAMFVISQAKFILELNLLTTQNGFSAVKNAGILFQKKINICMEELEKILKTIKKINWQKSSNNEKLTYLLHGLFFV